MNNPPHAKELIDMCKNEIISKMACDKVIEKYIYHFSEDKELLQDLSQEVYIELLNYPEQKIVEADRLGTLLPFAFKIAKTMMFSETSRFYYKYLRYENKRRSLDDSKEYQKD